MAAGSEVVAVSTHDFRATRLMRLNEMMRSPTANRLDLHHSPVMIHDIPCIPPEAHAAGSGAGFTEQYQCHR